MNKKTSPDNGLLAGFIYVLLCRFLYPSFYIILASLNITHEGRVLFDKDLYFHFIILMQKLLAD